jgi:Protein of unknown function (DUF2490)
MKPKDSIAKVTLLFCVFCAFLRPTSASADTTAPTQLWLTTAYSQNFDYGLTFDLEMENRLSTEGTLYRRNEITPSLRWRYSPRYDFGLGYENSESWDALDASTSGHEGFLYATVKLPLREWNFTSRQRVQGGVNREETTNVFRHRLRVDYNNPRFPFRLQPFLANEWFLDLRDLSLAENRAQLGLAYPLNQAVQLELYAMRQDQWTLAGELTTTTVLGLNLSLNF